MISTLADPDDKTCWALIEDVRNPLTCWNRFLKPSSFNALVPLSGDNEECDEGGQALLEAQDSALNQAKGGYNRAVGDLLDLLVNLMQGKHTESLKNLSQSGEPLAKAIQAAASLEDETEKKKLPEMVIQLCLVIRAFDIKAGKVSGTATTPAPSLISTLAQGKDADHLAHITADRERVWKLVQAERRKYVTFSTPRGSDVKDSLQNALRASGKVHSFNGTLNASHRLFCASADLWSESVSEPWLNSTVPKESDWKLITDFCCNTGGATDFGMMFDGRMREVRRFNESCVTLSFAMVIFDVHILY